MLHDDHRDGEVSWQVDQDPAQSGEAPAEAAMAMMSSPPPGPGPSPWSFEMVAAGTALSSRLSPVFEVSCTVLSSLLEGIVSHTMRPETTFDQPGGAVAGSGRDGDRAGGEALLRVMVVDDHPVFAEALALAMNASGQVSCVAIAPDADEAQRLASETEPDVVVMDVELGGTDGIAATRSLREGHPGTRVLVLTAQAPTATLVQAAADAGASALLSKGASLSVVVETVSSLTDHCFTLDRRTVGVLCAPALSGQDARTRPASALLTRREQDILGLLVSGVDLQTASVRLGITVNTARGYVKNLYRKLGVHNQLELLAVAREKGLLEPAG